MRRSIAALLLALSVTSCASFINGDQQKVRITTPGAADTKCFVRNDYFLYILYPPRTFWIERTRQPYAISCWAPGNRHLNMTVPSGYEPDVNWNATNGYIFGAAVDAVSNAFYRYPDEFVIDFTNTKPEPYAEPDYQRMLDQNPLMKGMEEFRPGEAALQSDENVVVQPMQKRVPGSDEDTFGALETPSSSDNGNDAGGSSSNGSPSESASSHHDHASNASTASPAPATTPVPNGSTASPAGTASGTTTGTLMQGLPSWGQMNGQATTTTSTTTTTSGTNNTGTATNPLAPTNGTTTNGMTTNGTTTNGSSTNGRATTSGPPTF